MMGWFRRWLRSRRYYRCICGFEVLKSEAKVSGGFGYWHGFHVHCPRCGLIIAEEVSP